MEHIRGNLLISPHPDSLIRKFPDFRHEIPQSESRPKHRSALLMHLLHSGIVHSLDCAAAALVYLCVNQAITLLQQTDRKSTTMAFLNISHSFEATILERASATWKSMSEQYAQYRLQRRTLNELSALSNRDLADLGIHRSNIRAAAHAATHGN